MQQEESWDSKERDVKESCPQVRPQNWYHTHFLGFVVECHLTHQCLNFVVLKGKLDSDGWTKLNMAFVDSYDKKHVHHGTKVKAMPTQTSGLCWVRL